MVLRIAGQAWARRYGQVALALVCDCVLLAACLLAAVWLRFDAAPPLSFVLRIPALISIDLLTKIPAFATQGLYSLSWSQIGLEDVGPVLRGATLGSAALGAALLLLGNAGILSGVPGSLLMVDYVLTILSVTTLRLGPRALQYMAHPSRSGRKALIVGAGTAGEQLARSLKHVGMPSYYPVGFIDDDMGKVGSVIHGIRVLGGRDRLSDVIRQHAIEAVLIAMPSVPSRVIRSVVSAAREAGVQEIRIIPALERILSGATSFTDLRGVQLADLLGRDQVQIDRDAVDRWLHDRTVAVTGAGGSIGSELCRQIGRFHPREVILIDCDETSLFSIEREMQRLGKRYVGLLLNIRDVVRIREAFHTLRPQIVFHAAAYKHVGLLERFPAEAVSTNVLGTYAVALAANEAGVDTFVMISTDKAVNPSSIMGATKRVAEQVCLAINARSGTRYITVRFGNVLGSRGSVIPIFQENIRLGEPLIVRGSAMRRYFMATPEAVSLILHAGGQGVGGEVFVLDMGEPIRIIDLARELVRLSGLEPDTDVPIIFSDPQPGERDHEDLLTAEEGAIATRHDRIFIAREALRMAPDLLFSRVASLGFMVERGDVGGIVTVLQDLVPNYRPSQLVQDLAAAAPSE